MPECSSPSFDEFNFSAPGANAVGALQASQTMCALGVAGVSHAEWSDRADKCLSFSGGLCSSTRLISHSCPSRATSLGPLFTSHNPCWSRCLYDTSRYPSRYCSGRQAAPTAVGANSPDCILSPRTCSVRPFAKNQNAHK